MQPTRKINNTEKTVVKYLVKKASLVLPEGWDENLFVQQIEDGGMGSFLILQGDSDDFKRKFGKQVSEFEFVDDDGVLVLVSLNLDDQNKLLK